MRVIPSGTQDLTSGSVIQEHSWWYSGNQNSVVGCIQESILFLYYLPSAIKKIVFWFGFFFIFDLFSSICGPPSHAQGLLTPVYTLRIFLRALGDHMWYQGIWACYMQDILDQSYPRVISKFKFPWLSIDSKAQSWKMLRLLYIKLNYTFDFSVKDLLISFLFM